MPVNATLRNGSLFCPYCNLELKISVYKEDNFLHCETLECMGSQEKISWNEEGKFLDEEEK